MYERTFSVLVVDKTKGDYLSDLVLPKECRTSNALGISFSNLVINDSVMFVMSKINHHEKLEMYGSTNKILYFTQENNLEEAVNEVRKIRVKNGYDVPSIIIYSLNLNTGSDEAELDFPDDVQLNLPMIENKSDLKAQVSKALIEHDKEEILLMPCKNSMI